MSMIVVAVIGAKHDRDYKRWQSSPGKSIGIGLLMAAQATVSAERAGVLASAAVAKYANSRSTMPPARTSLTSPGILSHVLTPDAFGPRESE
jgi:hypothetical protein